MKILALDTATEACSAALLVDGQLIAREAEFERGHAEHILSMVDAVLAEGGVALTGIDALAFGRGPGAFTGVRLAASVTQGLAFAADRPVVPVSDLAAVALRAFDLDPGMPRVLVCNDARMQEVYWACFEHEREGSASGPAAGAGLPHPAAPLPPLGAQPPLRSAAPLPPLGAQTSPLRPALRLVGAERVGPPASVTLPVEWHTAAGVIGAVGRGFRAYPELRESVLARREGGPPVRLISDTLLPRAHEIARLAVPEVEAGRVLPPEEAIPVYLRDDVARPPAASRN